MLADRPILMYCSIINPTFFGYGEISSYWLIKFSSVFHFSPSIGNPRMNPVSFVKTTASYEVS